MSELPTVLILTPLKDAERHVPGYAAALARLSYPPERLALGLLESDSQDGTWAAVQARLPEWRARYRRAEAWQRPFGFQLPAGMPRWAAAAQVARRTTLAKSRNELLFRALTDDDVWVLWLDADVIDYPPDVIQQLLAAQIDIVQPHCVKVPGGPSFDQNAWRERGRLHMDDLRTEGPLVRLDAVGATMLLVRAEAHRAGLIFPPFLYGRRSRLLRPDNGLGAPERRWRRRLRQWAGRLINALPGEHARMGEIETEGLAFQHSGIRSLEFT